MVHALKQQRNKGKEWDASETNWFASGYVEGKGLQVSGVAGRRTFYPTNILPVSNHVFATQVRCFFLCF